MTDSKTLEMQPLDEEKLRDAFELFDEDKDGELTAEEIQKIMNLHGIFPTEEELTEMIEKVDRNSNGTIDYEEFLQMMLGISKVNEEEEEDDIKQAFKIFDKDGDGLITAEEIRLTMTGLGEELSESELTAMLTEADLNGDGFIDFSEFSNLMKNQFGLAGSADVCQGV